MKNQFAAYKAMLPQGSILHGLVRLRIDQQMTSICAEVGLVIEMGLVVKGCCCGGLFQEVFRYF